MDALGSLVLMFGKAEKSESILVLHIPSQDKRLGVYGAGNTFGNAKSVNAL